MNYYDSHIWYVDPIGKSKLREQLKKDMEEYKGEIKVIPGFTGHVKKERSTRDKVRAHFKKLGMPQKSIAEKFDISITVVYRIFHAEGRVSDEMAENIANKLGIL